VWAIISLLNDFFFILIVKGDEILTKDEQFTLTPLQLHCITSRLGMAAPTCGMGVSVVLTFVVVF